MPVITSAALIRTQLDAVRLTETCDGGQCVHFARAHDFPAAQFKVRQLSQVSLCALFLSLLEKRPLILRSKAFETRHATSDTA